MPNQPSDPIISEVRAIRDAHAARFGYDMAAIFRISGRCRMHPNGNMSAFLGGPLTTR